jgi:hypothetical protein
MNAAGITSSSSNRAKILRNPLSLRNKRSISLCRLHICLSHSHGDSHFFIERLEASQDQNQLAGFIAFACPVHQLSLRLIDRLDPQLASSFRLSGSSLAYRVDSMLQILCAICVRFSPYLGESLKVVKTSDADKTKPPISQ